MLEIIEVQEETALTKLAQAAQWLAEAKTLDEVKHILNVSEAARTYARAAKLGLEAMNDAAEVKLRAERKAGELLAQLERGTPGVKPELFNSVLDNSEYKEVLNDQNINYMTAHRWQAIADLPEEKFESHLTEVKQSGQELTTAGVLRLTREQRRDEKIQDILSYKGRENEQLSTYRNFNVICADPPWRYDFSLTQNREIENQYPTMSVEEICDLKVPAADDCVLFLWATNPKLREALQVIEAWGFEYKTNMVWVKDKIGMGYYARQQHELILIATKGNLPVPEPSDRPSSVIHAPRTEHSEKPQELYSLILEMYPQYKPLEMFARNKRDGWFVWGNQV